MQKIENQQIGPHCILACLYFLLLPTTIALNSAGNSILKLATIPIGLFFVVTMILSNRKLHINGVHLALLVYTFSAISWVSWNSCFFCFLDDGFFCMISSRVLDT